LYDDKLQKSAYSLLRNNDLVDSIVKLENEINSYPDKFINMWSDKMRDLITSVKQNWNEEFHWNDNELNKLANALLLKFKLSESVYNLICKVNREPMNYIIDWEKHLKKIINSIKQKYIVNNYKIKWKQGIFEELVKKNYQIFNQTGSLLKIEEYIDADPDNYIIGWTKLLTETIQKIKKNYHCNLTWNDQELMRTSLELAKQSSVDIRLENKLDECINEKPQLYLSEWSKYEDIISKLNNIFDHKFSGELEIVKTLCTKKILELLKKGYVEIEVIMNKLSEVIASESNTYLKPSKRYIEETTGKILDQVKSPISTSLPAGLTINLCAIRQEIEYLLIDRTSLDVLVTILMKRVNNNPLKYSDRLVKRDESVDHAMTATRHYVPESDKNWLKDFLR